MKKQFLNGLSLVLFTLSLGSCLTCLPLFAAEPDNKPVLSAEKEWTMVVVPDPQQYTSTRNFPIGEIMMNWIVENRKPLEIREVVCVGDLVNSNPDEAMWDFSSRTFRILDGNVPYMLCTGNHDYGDARETSNNRNTSFNKYYPSDRNPLWKDCLVEKGKNSFGEENLENAAFQIQTPGGQTVLTIILPFAPTDANLEWAKEVAARPEYENAFVIVATHDYMLSVDRKNVLNDSRGYQILKTDGNIGQDIWDKLIYPSSNIRLVLCGHISSADNFSGCVGFRMDKNSVGRDVAQMLFDTQALGGGFGGNGGDGWLRLLVFSPDLKRVKAITWSPFFALSPSTRHLARETSAYNEFEFILE